MIGVNFIQIEAINFQIFFWKIQNHSHTALSTKNCSGKNFPLTKTIYLQNTEKMVQIIGFDGVPGGLAPNCIFKKNCFLIPVRLLRSQNVINLSRILLPFLPAYYRFGRTEKSFSARNPYSQLFFQSQMKMVMRFTIFICENIQNLNLKSYLSWFKL